MTRTYALVTLADIARKLGVTRQRAHQVAQKPDFPQIFAATSAGRLWHEADVDRFITDWGRQPGRPKKETS